MDLTRKDAEWDVQARDLAIHGTWSLPFPSEPVSTRCRHCRSSSMVRTEPTLNPHLWAEPKTRRSTAVQVCSRVNITQNRRAMAAKRAAGAGRAQSVWLIQFLGRGHPGVVADYTEHAVGLVTVPDHMHPASAARLGAHRHPRSQPWQAAAGAGWGPGRLQ